MKTPFTVGVVGHFGLAVRDPKRSAKWFERALGLKKIGHMSFHLPNMTALRKALAHLKKHKVDLEDPGNEIGPESLDSPHRGIWFHDLDGYRRELSVQGKR